MEEILGLHPIVLTILMIIGGVGINNALGWLQSKDPVNPRKIAASIIIGAIAGFGIIMPVVQGLIESIPTDEYIQFTAIVVGILSLVGVDTLTKNVGASIRK